LNRKIADLKAEIETIEDPKQREIGQAMAILVSSIEVGPDADRLIEHTGFSPDFVRNIVDRMTQGGLWTGEVVDDQEWWDGDQLNEFVLFIHAHVALGVLSRRVTLSAIEYLDNRTGKVVAKGRDQLQ
jgi:hypothetical protein